MLKKGLLQRLAASLSTNNTSAVVASLSTSSSPSLLVLPFSSPATTSHQVNSKRWLSSRQLQYKKRGADPNEFLSIKTEELPDSLGPDQVLLRWLACPINPADLNMIQGSYPLLPPLPAVGGNEGVARVEKIGKAVTSLSPGDRVVPASAELGTWREYSIIDGENQVLKVSPDLSNIQAATLLINPPTAYRMLKDFKDLGSNDIVVQNGANSAVGRAVIQIARELDLYTVNIVRNRPEIDALTMELKELGGPKCYVVTDAEFPRFFDYRRNGKHPFKKLKALPKLALNCVGGKQSVFMGSALDDKGVIVTYGGMSKLPSSLPVGAFIFKDIQARGFWMSRWYKQAFSEDQELREKIIRERG